MDHVTTATSCFLPVFITHQCLCSGFFALLIATGKYLSAQHWQASRRVLLKWCYTGPSTCNCVAAAQSWPLKGQAVIYLKWQQPHFYLPVEQKKKTPPHTALYLFWQRWWADLMLFPCIYMLCRATWRAAGRLGHGGAATFWPFLASCHQDTKLWRNGLVTQTLFTNPVKCWAAIGMAYLDKHGLYSLCGFSSNFWRSSWAFAGALIALH